MKKFLTYLLVSLAIPALRANDMEPTDTAKDEAVNYILADMAAQFYGGSVNNFMVWLASHIRYTEPVAAAAAEVSERAVVQFTVDTLGCVGRVKVLRGLHPDLDSEVVRTIYASPRWTPGQHQGKVANIIYSIPMPIVKPPQLKSNRGVFEFHRRVARQISRIAPIRVPYGKAVSINFGVDTSGSLGAVDLDSNINAHWNNELICMMYEHFIGWEPARMGHHSVNMYCNLCFTFGSATDSILVKDVQLTMSMILEEEKHKLTFQSINRNIDSLTYYTPPKFKGNDDIEVFKDWVVGMIAYPEEAIILKIEGRMEMQFVVNE
ncbi:MAG: energy transducer TonB, partial [Prevotellaceae bacterium]|nr:energy transducer TonB [Prevotellaceae bacterium]